MDALLVLQELLSHGNDVTREDVVKKLGNTVAALKSVPTAIYCFLRALQPIAGIEVRRRQVLLHVEM